jgi:hypothetical protein
MIDLSTEKIWVSANAGGPLSPFLALAARQTLVGVSAEALLVLGLWWALQGRSPKTLRFPAWAAPTAVGVLCLAIREGVYKNTLWVSDEAAYDFQARIFQAGRTWVKPPPFPGSFTTPNLLLHGDHWSSQYAPGWPLLLAVGRSLGLENLVNPLLTALAVLALQKLARQWARERAQNPDSAEAWCGALCLLCPFLVCNGATLFPHSVSLLLAALGVLFLGSRPGLSGLAFGLLSSVRQPEAAMLLLALSPWLIQTTKRGWLPFGLALLIGASPGLLDNWIVNGGILKSGYSLSGDNAILHESLGLKVKLITVCVSRLLAWMPPLAMAGALAALARTRSFRSPAWMVLFVSLAYLPIFGRASLAEFGTRYLFIPVLLWLPIAAVELSERVPCPKKVLLTLALFSTVVAYVPILVLARQAFQDKANVETWLHALGSDALVLFRFDPDRIDQGNMRNAPDLSGQIRAMFLDPEVTSRLRTTFSGRPAYLIDWNPATHLYTAIPYEADHDPGFDCLCGGLNLVQSLHDQAAAVETWSSCPPQSAWKRACEQNAAQLARKMKSRQAEATTDP